ncbi:MAG TPA: YbjN domain-containing protein [Candidatus Corynebacterium avicola]|uniref:YbjN domain-containing protein n=1 Tax=Candidatus Corynebacterium avicola TaxID=2838527 RepID=A0A9D1RTV4_9CORY|nr:YbjN domain-containing protein [Candidatus Corynebacterium avicola]
MSDYTSDHSNHTGELTTSVPDGVLQPLSRHRVMAALETLGYAYTVDRDRRVSGDWGTATFGFDISGPDECFFSVRGYWDRYLPAERYADMLEHANNWNNGHYMPMAAVVSDPDGDLHFVTDYAVDYGYGATDEQICRHIERALSPAGTFFEELDDLFPDSVHL